MWYRAGSKIGAKIEIWHFRLRQGLVAEAAEATSSYRNVRVKLSWPKAGKLGARLSLAWPLWPIGSYLMPGGMISCAPVMRNPGAWRRMSIRKRAERNMAGNQALNFMVVARLVMKAGRALNALAARQCALAAGAQALIGENGYAVADDAEHGSPPRMIASTLHRTSCRPGIGRREAGMYSSSRETFRRRRSSRRHRHRRAACVCETCIKSGGDGGEEAKAPTWHRSGGLAHVIARHDQHACSLASSTCLASLTAIVRPCEMARKFQVL